MIGVYDYTVIATYLSLVLGINGIIVAAQGGVFGSSLCLLLAGLLDAFDGRIARTKKNRTEQEKRFGIQIDSLNDLVCFGVLPAMIGCALGGDSIPFRATMAFFVLAALIRLAFFNVTEEERQAATKEGRKFYLGVPVTSASFLAPLFWLVAVRFSLPITLVYAVMLFILGVLFITPLHIAKPGLRGIIIMVLIGAFELYLMVTCGLALG